MKHGERKEQKQLLVVGKKCHKAIKELAKIRNETRMAEESLDIFKETDKAIKLMKKLKSSLVMAQLKSHILLGRSFNGEFIDLIKFKIVKILSTADLTMVPPHLNMKCAVLILNVNNFRLENLIIDIFAQNTNAVALDALKYAWIFVFDGSKYLLKYVRICKDSSVEDVGPYFELEIESEYHCDEDLWEKALDLYSKKKTKNVSKTALNETVGKVYVDKQDLKEINLRKNKANKRVKTEL